MKLQVPRRAVVFVADVVFVELRAKTEKQNDVRVPQPREKGALAEELPSDVSLFVQREVAQANDLERFVEKGGMRKDFFLHDATEEIMELF